MAREHRLTPRHIEALAETLAPISTPMRRAFREAKGAAAMEHLLDLNMLSFEPSPVFAADEVARLNRRIPRRIERA